MTWGQGRNIQGWDRDRGGQHQHPKTLHTPLQGCKEGNNPATISLQGVAGGGERSSVSPQDPFNFPFLLADGVDRTSTI